MMMHLFCLRRGRSLLVLLEVYHIHSIRRSTRIAELGVSSRLELRAIEIKNFVDSS